MQWPDAVHPSYFFTPPANKPGELHRINILVIEIGFPKKSGPAVPHQTQLQTNQIVMMTKWLLKKRLGKNYCKDPAHYIRLISFTPPANKPAELHRINILVIEIGFPKKSGQAVPHQTQFQLIQIIKTIQSRLDKYQLFKNSFIPIWRKFLDSLCQKQGLRPAKMQGRDWPRVLQKQSPPRFGLLRRKYLWGSILFTKTLLLPKPVSRPGCYD